jgi:hypothetical protein
MEKYDNQHYYILLLLQLLFPDLTVITQSGKGQPLVGKGKINIRWWNAAG